MNPNETDALAKREKFRLLINQVKNSDVLSLEASAAFLAWAEENLSKDEMDSISNLKPFGFLIYRPRYVAYLEDEYLKVDAEANEYLNDMILNVNAVANYRQMFYENPV